MSENPYSAPHSDGDQTPEKKRPFFRLQRLIFWLGATAVIAVLIALVLLAVTRDARPAARRTMCKNNLKQIMLALHNYHERYGSFPPAYTVDEKGQPLHSWRTLILPWLDQKQLYDSIDRSKPWNDPANATAFNTPLYVFHCPSEKNDRQLTTYQAVVGPGAGFEFTGVREFRDFHDGTSQTILVMEVDTALAVHWMAPFDHGYEYLLTSQPEAKTVHVGGSHAAITDGSIRFLSHNLDRPTRRALISITGGETIGDF